MIYKRYEAVIEYDEEDRLFFGRVMNIEDVIVFDGLSVEELEQSFQQVIDEYLADNQAMNQKRDRIEKATALKFAKVYKLSN